ncbi:arsenate reductase [Chelonobacter oris]|uniref:Arsenate reductase n=1 Tax=Chelonobacter oris TaxID=505317 RepID=A0A0A3BCX2_9PAST|nr:arsenate reductase (glutaredoxin) [Chelonobacter oris]KGQ71389.1 arsenate reductase [Chelonobacter oris]
MTGKVKILHNPTCSKSRETLQLLESRGIAPEVEVYLQKAYSVAELQTLCRRLGIDDVRRMMRVNDELYRTLGLDNPALTQQQLLAALAQHSALLERPIVINGEQARIGRPPQAVLEIL